MSGLEAQKSQGADGVIAVHPPDQEKLLLVSSMVVLVGAPFAKGVNGRRRSGKKNGGPTNERGIHMSGRMGGRGRRSGLESGQAYTASPALIPRTGLNVDQKC